MTIYFCNAEPINLLALEVMGLNVKEGENPIGFFGTGLKYAIATLLRTGHVITITRQLPHDVEDRITFATKIASMRGKEFAQVQMLIDDGIMKTSKDLGFTTELGKNWLPWMVFRELHSNVLDERGTTQRHAPAAGEWGTVIAVEGAGIEQAWLNRESIFIEQDRKPLASSNKSHAEIFDGETKYVFYRGIRAFEGNVKCLATYNITTQMQLTEDRTIASLWLAAEYVGNSVQMLRDKQLLERILHAPQGTFEFSFNYSKYLSVSEEFLEVVRKNRRNVNLSRSALEVWKHKCPEEKYADWEDIEESPRHRTQIKMAFDLLCKLGVQMQRQDFKIVRGLGQDIMGLYVRDTDAIFLAESTLDMGYRVIASTLYEEWLHKTEGLQDESRSMQNFLFNKLIALLEDNPAEAAQ